MTPRIVAIVPAAGLSRRMGEPKLLLSLGGQSVIARVVNALQSAGVAEVIVVVRPDDDPLAHEVRTLPATLLQPAQSPPSMRDSVECAIQLLMQRGAEWDGWLLIPADHPTLDVEPVSHLIAAWSRDRTRIAVPTWNGRRGHPTLFPWSSAGEVSQLPADAGLNYLLRSRPDRVHEIESTSSEVLNDMDTPEDWQRISARWS